MTIDPLAHFPFVPTGLIVELDLDGDGTYAEDVTPYLRGSDPAAVWVAPERGQQSEGAAAPPAQVALRFDNADRRFSPRAPMGATTGGSAELPLSRPRSPPARRAGRCHRRSRRPGTITSGLTDLDVRVMISRRTGRASGGDALAQWVEAGNKWLDLLPAQRRSPRRLHQSGGSSLRRP